MLTVIEIAKSLGISRQGAHWRLNQAGIQPLIQGRPGVASKYSDAALLAVKDVRRGRPRKHAASWQSQRRRSKQGAAA